MSKQETPSNWVICKDCKGQGKKRRRVRKKVRLQYQRNLDQIERGALDTAPDRPKGHLYSCPNCKGSGLIASDETPKADEVNFPRVAIIGGGIGGVALAVACKHRGIPFILYERDESFDTRSQGYGLTLQQASREIRGLGLVDLKEGVVSTRHIMHSPDGQILGEWGMRKWIQTDPKGIPKRTNIHIGRQSLRLALMEQLHGLESIKWNHKMIDLQESNGKVALRFEVNEGIIKENADIVVGADGIRSTVRELIIGNEKTPLRYLGCIVILGICSIKDLEHHNCELLDSATIFQTANGNERIYVMPYDKASVMWQLSFPMSEHDAKALSKKGVIELKNEASKRVPWHHPIPQIISNTPEHLISGYPVYDRKLIQPEWLKNLQNITLIGDAAHPMSPFKGQGANQALLDALGLARTIMKKCRPGSGWRKSGIRTCVLDPFEKEMFSRTEEKVRASAAAAEILHSQLVMTQSNKPRGSILKDREPRSMS